MRVTEFFPAFPQIIWALAFATVMGRGMVNCAIALAITWWAQYARAHARPGPRQREKEFILTARALGQRQWRILLFHLLPNCLSLVVRPPST
jgi:peptide/nickel transport system permease protein